MFYIFNKENICIATCSDKPNYIDLNTRQEYCIESPLNIDITKVEKCQDGTIREKQ